MPIEEEGYPSTELPSFDDAPNYYAEILEYFAAYQCLLSFPQITTLTFVEPAKNLPPILRKKLSGNSKVRFVNGNLQSVASSRSCDSVVLINVLEHVENDEELLSTIHQVLQPGGTVLLLVPALSGLYGSLDEEFGAHPEISEGRIGFVADDGGLSG